MTTFRAPSSSGLGHRPLTPVTGVRVPLGSPVRIQALSRLLLGAFFISPLHHFILQACQYPCSSFLNHIPKKYFLHLKTTIKIDQAHYMIPQVWHSGSAGRESQLQIVQNTKFHRHHKTWILKGESNVKQSKRNFISGLS